MILQVHGERVHESVVVVQDQNCWFGHDRPSWICCCRGVDRTASPAGA
jgi:hypothetical protein